MVFSEDKTGLTKDRYESLCWNGNKTDSIRMNNQGNQVILVESMKSQ